MPTLYYNIKTRAGNDTVIKIWNGTTWYELPFGVEADGRSPTSVYVLSAIDVWVGCTNNGIAQWPALYHWNGLTWTKYDTITGWNVAPGPHPTYGPSSKWHVKDIWMFDTDHGYAVLEDSNHTDGGQIIEWDGALGVWKLGFDMATGVVKGNLFSVRGTAMNSVYVAGSSTSGTKPGLWYWTGNAGPAPVSQDLMGVGDGNYIGMDLMDAAQVYAYCTTTGGVYKGAAGAWVLQYTLAANLRAAAGANGILSVNPNTNNVWISTWRSTDSHPFVVRFDGAVWSATDINGLKAGFTNGAWTKPMACSRLAIGNDTAFIAPRTDTTPPTGQRPYFVGGAWGLSATDPEVEGVSAGTHAYDITDATIPYLDHQTPAHLDTGVLRNATISLDVLDLTTAVAESTVLIDLDINGAGWVPVWATSAAQPGFGVVETIVLTGYRYVITPVVQFQYNDIVLVRVRATDLVDNTLDTTYTFYIMTALITCGEPQIGSDFTINNMICLPTQHSNASGRVFSAPYFLNSPMASFRQRNTPLSSSIQSQEAKFVTIPQRKVTGSF